MRGQVLQMSKHKFASNVVEKCVAFGTKQDRQLLIDEVITVKSDGTSPLVVMMKDQFANVSVVFVLFVGRGSNLRVGTFLLLFCTTSPAPSHGSFFPLYS